MTEFQKITASPEALTELLASILTTDGPWEEAWEQAHCTDCEREGLRRLPA